MKFLILIILSFHLHASNWQSFQLGLGQFYELPAQTETNKSEFFQLSPVICSKAHYQLSDAWNFSPALNWVFYKTHENSSSNQNIFIPQINFTYQVSSEFLFSLGTSILIYSTSGDGTEEELPNGTGETTYYAPNERKNSYQQNLNFSVSYLIDEYSVNLESYFYKLLNSELRETSLLFSFSKSFEIP